MKKSAVFGLILAMVFLVCTGCSQAKNGVKEMGEGAGQVAENAKDSAKNMAEGAMLSWDNVKDEFGMVETDAKNGFASFMKGGKENVMQMISKAESGMKKMENGVTEANKDAARDVYEAGSTLENFAQYKDEEHSREIAKLGTDMKTLVKHYFGQTEGNFDTLKQEIATEIDKVKAYDDGDWMKINGTVNG